MLRGANVPVSALVRYRAMSLGVITIGVIACLFAIFALLPPFDGKWGA